MKVILLFALVAIAACNEFPVEQDLQSNIVDTIKCFVEKSLPLLPQVTEIITAIKEQDFMTVVMIGMALYEDIKEMIAVCIPKEQILTIQWNKFASCAQNIGSLGGVVLQFVMKIILKDIIGASFLLPSVVASGGDVIIKCGKFLL
jgi:hypothetical protein